MKDELENTISSLHCTPLRLRPAAAGNARPRKRSGICSPRPYRQFSACCCCAPVARTCQGMTQRHPLHTHTDLVTCTLLAEPRRVRRCLSLGGTSVAFIVLLPLYCGRSRTSLATTSHSGCWRQHRWPQYWPPQYIRNVVARSVGPWCTLVQSVGSLPALHTGITARGISPQVANWDTLPQVLPEVGWPWLACTMSGTRLTGSAGAPPPPPQPPAPSQPMRYYITPELGSTPEAPIIRCHDTPLIRDLPPRKAACSGVGTAPPPDPPLRLLQEWAQLKKKFQAMSDTSKSGWGLRVRCA